MTYKLYHTTHFRSIRNRLVDISRIWIPPFSSQIAIPLYTWGKYLQSGSGKDIRRFLKSGRSPSSHPQFLWDLYGFSMNHPALGVPPHGPMTMETSTWKQQTPLSYTENARSPTLTSRRFLLQPLGCKVHRPGKLLHVHSQCKTMPCAPSPSIITMFIGGIVYIYIYKPLIYIYI